MPIANAQPTVPRTVAVAVRYCLCMALLACASGASCGRTVRNPFTAWNVPPAPEVLISGASRDQILAAVNQNTARITSYQTTNASISVPGATGVPSLRGNLAVERPGRIRLQASTALTGPEVDLGSNDELFWVWVKRSDPPALYSSRHDRYAGSAAQQFLPIEPSWLLDALGLTEFRPTDIHEGPVAYGKGTVEIKSVITGNSGQTTKRTVVDARTACVLEQHVYDPAGKLLASAVLKSHRFYPEVGASLPQHVEIQIPQAGLALTIDVGTVAINAPVENPQIWTLPTIAGVPSVDLGAAPPPMPGGGIATLGSQISSADWYGPTPVGGTPAPLATAGSHLPQTVNSNSTMPNATAAIGQPQFVPPGGVAQQFDPIAELGQSPTPAAAQRLPAGGITGEPVFTR